MADEDVHPCPFMIDYSKVSTADYSEQTPFRLVFSLHWKSSIATLKTQPTLVQRLQLSASTTEIDFNEMHSLLLWIHYLSVQPHTIIKGLFRSE